MKEAIIVFEPRYPATETVARLREPTGRGAEAAGAPLHKESFLVVFNP